MSQTEVQLIKADAVQTADIANSAVTDAKISGLTSSKLTGALPAISGASLTNLPASGKAKNLVVNGAMQIAQRATSSTSSLYAAVDRFRMAYASVDENPTSEQANVATDTTPYSLGFTKCLKVTNGNQTSGAGSSDRIAFEYRIEAQDVARSGWDYQSTSGKITLSFWIRSSVAQNFYLYFETADGTAQAYAMETGSLSANTWTKVTKTIPGKPSLQFDNDANLGLKLYFSYFTGTDYTDNSQALNTWGTYNTASRFPDNTSTWYTTNDATLEITGVQLEVGDSATDFEHKTFAEDLHACQRYYDKSYSYSVSPGTATSTGAVVHTLSGSYNYAEFPIEFTRSMRADPTITLYSTNNGNTGKTSADSGDGNASVSYQNEKRAFVFRANSNNGMGTNVFLRCQFQADAEL